MTIVPTNFRATERDGLRLIVPSHEMATASSPWTAETVFYRSRVETIDGELVSVGFGKFFNIGQGPDGLAVHAHDVAAATERGDAIATLKIDGSLLCRSVHHGRVSLRTRGTVGYDHCANAAEVDAFLTRHARLGDASFVPHWSLLFEWVSPSNRIVLHYPEPQLYLVGAVEHATLRYVPMATLAEIARELGVELVPWFTLDASGWEQLQQTLQSAEDIEGYVIRVEHEQRLVKVKAVPYLTKHALKSRLTTADVVDRWLQGGQPDFQGFVKQFSADFDEETCMWAMPVISAMFDGIRELRALIAHMDGKVAERRHLSRKEFALAFQAEYGTTKTFALAMRKLDGRTDNDALIKSILLQRTKQMELSFLNTARAEEETDA